MFFLSDMTRYGWEVVIGFAFPAMYLLLVLWARSKYIASTNRVWTEAHVDAVRANVAVLHAAFPSTGTGLRRSATGCGCTKRSGDWSG